MNTNTRILVIGYGNELRGDDAVGPHVARVIEKLHLPGVRVIICQLLTPELADEIAHAGDVVFIDASVDAAEVTLREVSAATDRNIIAHSNSPAAMLALARAAFSHEPRAWWLTIPVVHLGFTDQLTSAAVQNVAMAARELQRLLVELGSRP